MSLWAIWLTLLLAPGASALQSEGGKATPREAGRGAPANLPRMPAAAAFETPRATTALGETATVEAAPAQRATGEPAAGPAQPIGAWEAEAATAQGGLERLSEQVQAGRAAGSQADRAALERGFSNGRGEDGAQPPAGVEPARPRLHPSPLSSAEKGSRLQVEPPRPATPQDNEPSGRRALGLIDMLALGVNAIVGSGIFVFPGRLAALLGAGSVVSFALTGLLLVPVGLAFAEAATYFRANGGAYLYTRQAFGPWPAFGVAWMTWLSQMFGWAAVASVIAASLAFFHPIFAVAAVAKGVALVVIVLMAAVNFLGAKQGARTTNLFTAAKLLPLLLFVLVGLPHVRGALLHGMIPRALGPLGSASFLAYFAFQGFETVPIAAGEVKNPARTIPLAVIGSLLLAALFYVAVQFVAVGVAPGLAGSSKPLVDAASVVFGGVGAALMALGGAFSTTGFTAGVAFVSPRQLQAMAQDDHLPAALAKPHPRFGTPTRAILLTAGIAFILAGFVDFSRLVAISALAIGAQYLATCLAIPFLRRKGGAPAGAFRIPGGPTVPLLGAAVVAWLSFQAGLAQVWTSLTLLGVGLALKAGWALLKSQRARPDR